MTESCPLSSLRFANSDGLIKALGRSPPVSPRRSSAGSVPLDDRFFTLETEFNVGGYDRTFADDDDFKSTIQRLDLSGNKPNSVAEFSSMKAWQKEKILEALESFRPKYKFPHSEVTPLQSIEGAIDWASVKGVERSDTGSEGILFVELPNKRAVCVKCPAQVAGEVFGMRLCQRLRIRCPHFRVVKSNTAEGRLLFDSLCKCDANGPNAENSVQAMLSKAPLFIVIEYLQAMELGNKIAPVSNEWSKQVFGLAPGDPSEALGAHGKRILRFCGSLLVFDVLVNNYDRLPCMWSNQGNPGNIMFTARGEPISIDNMPCCFSGEFVKEYLKRVTHLVQLVAQVNFETREFKRVRKFFHTGCPEGHGWTGLGIDIGEAGTVEVQRGFLDTVRSLVGDGQGHNNPLDLRELSSLVSDLQSSLPLENGQNDYGFHTINLDFIAKVYKALRDGLQSARTRHSLKFGAVDLETLMVVQSGATRSEAYVEYNGRRHVLHRSQTAPADYAQTDTAPRRARVATLSYGRSTTCPGEWNLDAHKAEDLDVQQAEDTDGHKAEDEASTPMQDVEEEELERLANCLYERLRQRAQILQQFKEHLQDAMED